VEGRSFAEIAASLGIPAKRVRDRHHRAIEKLRRLSSGRY
jgi:DNA-directed RNA polymerase specialized sigma24 family protein